MRALILTLMILLLPLRGWIGDVMAMHASHTGDTTAAVTSTEDAHDCHQSLTFDAHATDMQIAHTDCNNCNMCDICHAGILTTDVSALETAPWPTVMPATSHPTDTSAERTQGFKPPIA